MALKLIKVNTINQRIIILLDTQVVIMAPTLQRQATSHYLLDWFHSELHHIKSLPRHANLEVEVTWVRGHKGNEGNELADQEAKRVARGKVSPTSHIPKCLRKTLPHSTSALKQQHLEKMKKRVTSDLAKSPQYSKIVELDPNALSPALRRLVDPHRGRTPAY